MKIGYYICNTCNDFITSDFPFIKLNCNGCGKDLPIVYMKDIKEKQFTEESKKFNRLSEYFSEDELIGFVVDKEFIKKEAEGKSVTNWSQGEIGDTGFYQLAQISPQHKGDKTTIFITSSKLVEEVTQ